MARNEAFIVWMDTEGWTAPDLATELNTAIGQSTGKPGTLSDVTVRKWRSGETTWPRIAVRLALEAISGRSAQDLGFADRRRKTSTPPEDSMLRRSFLNSTVGASASFVLAGPAPSVGTSDVLRLRAQLDSLRTLDDHRGGHATLEQAALAGAHEAARLQEKGASARTRERLFSLAAAFTAAATWSLIDAGRLDGAGQHLDRSLTLAGLAQDPEMVMQVWNLRAMLARQRGDYSEAVASAQAALTTAIARRSPLHASLAHARAAVGLAHGRDRRSALNCLGRAQESLAKVDPAQPRAAWIAFYGPAELYSLTAIVRDIVGDAAEAEAASHRALAVLPETYRRNRAYTTARLALAQLHQGDAEQACASGGQVFTIMAGTPLPGRMRRVLGDFQRELLSRAPHPMAVEWTDRYRTEWTSA
ncbi:XRE family transcriptional regulator [Streptomyces sp. NPDC088707]|uniref:XRE family transcriptional regulator n=1 Tax=Streptomyces sp. NPDC088707 TaxID=3365871 RepID=UPI003829F4C6